MTTKPNGRDATTRKTTETRQCSTGGKFIYFNNPGNEDPELQEFHMLLTYDSVKNTYPGMMMIGSSRYAIDATWDKATNTMTFRGISTEDGTTLVYQNRFIDSAHVETSGEVKNAGKVIMEQSIKQTRREK